MNVLITAGATREPIDDVRFISNVSSGATGAALAEALAAAGHRVTLLRGEAAVAGRGLAHEESFSSADDLAARLRGQLATGGFDAVIMTAAVADYRPVAPVAGKLSSNVEQLTLQLTRNAKILPQLKSFAPRPLRVVGFKLTSRASESERRSAVAAQFAAGGVDAVVHNDLAEIRATTRERHPFRLYRAAGADPLALAGTVALAAAIDEWLGTSSWHGRDACDHGRDAHPTS